MAIAMKQFMQLVWVAALALAAARTVDASRVHLDLGNEAHRKSVACSGMWAGSDTSILLTALGTPSTPVSTVFYEWHDFGYLGVNAHANTQYGYQTKTYVCTSQTVEARLCTTDQMGMWFGDPQGVQTSIQQSFLRFTDTQPIHRVRYNVNQTGYYCAAAVQLLNTSAVPPGTHQNAQVSVQFSNSFRGDLPASEWPRLTFSMTLSLVYLVLGLGWLGLCYNNRRHLLLTQYLVGAALALCLTDQGWQWIKYSYLNNHAIDLGTMRSWDGNWFITGFVRIAILVSSLLSASRDTACLVLLLLISRGFGVTRSNGVKLSLPLAILALINFVLETLYFTSRPWSTNGARFGTTLVILGMALTLTMLYTQIMASLSRMNTHLTARRQSYKANLFKTQRRVTLGMSYMVVAWFTIAFFTYAKRGTEDEPRVWKSRWFIWGGWMEIVVLLTLLATAWVWRPSAHNFRLASSEEVGTEDYVEEDFELGQHEARRSRESRDGPGATYTPRMERDEVVFAIGDEDEEDARHVARERERERERSRQVDGAPPGSEERRALIGAEDAE